MTTIETFISHLLAERRAAIKKFPTNRFQLAALTEEVGELSQALIDCEVRNPDQWATMARNHTIVNIYEEAVQVASCALRIATEGDSQFPSYIPAIGQGVSVWEYPQDGGNMQIVQKGIGQ